MSSKNVFRIKVKTKIPYLTNGVLYIAITAFIIFLLIELPLYPFKSGSINLRSYVFDRLYRIEVKYLYFSTVLTGCLAFILYNFLWQYISAEIIFNEESIEITSDDGSVQKIILIKHIRSISITDITSFGGRSKQKLKLSMSYIKRNSLELRLVNYEESEQLIHTLTGYKNLFIRFHAFPY